MVGLERSTYELRLNERSKEVCITVYTPRIECPIEFPFEIMLITSETTAGIIGISEHSKERHIVCANVTLTVNMILRFAACEVKSCVDVSVMENEIHITLELPSIVDGKIRVDQGGASAIIINTNYCKIFTYQITITLICRQLFSSTGWSGEHFV